MSLDAARAELAKAEVELAGWLDRWDRYDGNNPDKYRSDIKSARLAVSIAQTKVTSLEEPPHD